MKIKAHTVRKGLWALPLLGLSALLSSAPETKADPLEESLATLRESVNEAIHGSVYLRSRTRYEVFAPDAADSRHGFSQRWHYGYVTPDWEGLTFSVEGETLYPLGSSREELHPLDDAAVGTRLNQLWVQYADDDLLSAKLGRQVFVLGNHRFIGHVGWRQSNQVYDALTASVDLSEEASVTPFYLHRVVRVNGDREDLTGFGVNFDYTFSPEISLEAFAFRLDFDDLANFSNDTFGLRLSGAVPIEDWTIRYAASYAYQTDNSGNPSGTDFSLNYFTGELSAQYDALTFGGKFEILEGDGQQGFRTPLATVHAFNGFADVFLPLAGFPNGLEDYSVFAGYQIPIGNGLNTRVTYHYFQTENNRTKLGEEINFVASYRFNEFLSTNFKYGYFNSAGAAIFAPASQDKEMLVVDVNFTF
ncbi:MAG: alginate export family protein [Opitutales bacterium]|nr:alginate export family protein [Opitutales bacterium]MCH8540066.1 alginate export family protein [Opitutales bacterium]